MNTYCRTLFALLLTSLLSCICACQNEGKTLEAKATLAESIDLSKSVPWVLSEKVDSFNIIQLDDHPEALIGLISDLLIEDDGIYILDSHKGKSIYKFDFNGNLLFRINKFGNGPGEYQLLSDFDVYRGIIYAWDASSRKLFKFNSIDGSYVSDIKTTESFLIRDLKVLRNGNFLIANSNKNNPFKHSDLYLLDNSLNALDSVVGDPDLTNEFLSFGNYISNENGTLFFKKSTDNTIYEIRDSQIRERYNLAIPSSKALQKEDMLKSDRELQSMIFNNDLYAQSHSILHNDDFVSIGLVRGKDFNAGIFFSKNDLSIFSMHSMKNDMFDFEYKMPVSVYKNMFVSVIEPEGLEQSSSLLKSDDVVLDENVLNTNNLILVLTQMN